MMGLERLRARQADEAGTSLVELLVVMILFGVIGTMVTTELISTQQTQRNVSVRTQDLQSVQVGIESMTKLMGTAGTRPTTGTVELNKGIVTATGSNFTFYGYNLIGKAPSLISFYVDGNQQLIESVRTTTQCTSTQPSDWVYGAARTRVLARSVNAATQLFTYHAQAVAGNFAGPVIPMTGSPAAVPVKTSTTPLSTLTMADIDSVEINLSIDLPSTPDIPSAAVTTQVALPNQFVPETNTPGSAC